ncbi:PAS domain S-box protein [Haliea sp. E1-2-M8]|uniref:PAS domain S-box protein n=1 Tax=Haliea sp. E1-2-M8 TaxID=3064706 RepID=UPI0027203239|nr:PAS domain S-box protein [Haliea sp. E1-2-M8]MDO8862101.1 PAS domain S-box protein [Haliea sp. E1-2-M8]
MSTSSDEPAVFAQLRRKAEAQLKAGTPPSTQNWAMGVDALCMLHRLSSNPDTAQDALKLLHELQVHQVELDVQHEEIAANERVLMEDLSRYRALFDYAPAGYFLLDHEGTIVEGNLAAAELFGLPREDLGGHRIDTLLTAEFRPQLQEFLQQVVQSGVRASCTVQAKPAASGAATLQFVASILPGSECTLVTCSEDTAVG